MTASRKEGTAGFVISDKVVGLFWERGGTLLFKQSCSTTTTKRKTSLLSQDPDFSSLFTRGLLNACTSFSLSFAFAYAVHPTRISSRHDQVQARPRQLYGRISLNLLSASWARLCSLCEKFSVGLLLPWKIRPAF
eukprot:TRINITY_DN3830_c1_g1_i3.p1 TRINITY_DN3830_c1_g1~~TRINITY_DN3830_c1_g1_i3.p1  ORF type:complete len:135 (+),score=1.71 TRINITY_DN3830_c1_g1_i3:2680-3084(+)